MFREETCCLLLFALKMLVKSDAAGTMSEMCCVILVKCQERQQQRIQQANSSVPSGTPSQLSIASLAALAPTAGRGLWGRRILPPAPPNISAVIDTTHSAPAADAAVSSDGAAFAMSDAAVAAATTDTEAAAAVAEVAGAAGSREGVAVEGLVGLNMILARLGFEMLR